jgi:hypothetical protein
MRLLLIPGAARQKEKAPAKKAGADVADISRTLPPGNE